MGQLLLALSGKSNTGKSTTLKILIHMLCKTNAKIVRYNLCYPIPRGSAKLKNAPLCEQLTCSGDIWVVFAYNGYKIGITSQGDLRRYLKQDFLNLGDCNILICAVHSRGETVDFVRDWANKQSGQYLILQHMGLTCPKEIAKSLYQIVNYAQAKNLLELVNTITAKHDTFLAQQKYHIRYNAYPKQEDTL